MVLLKCLIASFTSREREAMAATKKFFDSGMGYYGMQSTKPQTLGFSLADSPVGLLAWIYEKLVTWTDSYSWTDDEGASNTHFTLYIIPNLNSTGFFAVLTWVSIYWFSRAGPAASVRIYYELTKAGEVIVFPKTTVPIGLSFFPKEILQFPKAYVPTLFLYL